MKNKNLLIFALMWLLMGVGGHVAYAQQKAVGVPEIMAAQAAYSKNIHSLTATYHSKNQFIESETKEAQAAGVDGAKTQRRIVFYALKGTKQLEQSKEAAADGTALPDEGLSPSLMVYDGKYQHLLTNMHVVSGKIVPEGGDQNGNDQTRDTRTDTAERLYPTPLDFGYRDETDWIANLLARGDFKVDGVEQSPQFGQLIRVQGEYENRQEALTYHFTFWFAPRYGFLSVRTESVSVQDGAKFTYQAESLKKIDGFWFATAGTREMSGLSKPLFSAPVYTPFARYSFALSGLQVNKAPDSLFEVKLTPGGQLYDQSGYVVYKIGPSGEKVVNHGFDEVLRGDPYRAWKGWLLMASLTTLLLLGLGAFVKWRRRNASA